jgi:hypothetical protein
LAVNWIGRFYETPVEESMSSSKIRNVLQAAMALSVMGPMTGCTAEVGEEAIASQEEAFSSGCAPTVPPALAVPAGNKLAFHLDAIGTQNYRCQEGPTGFAWVFVAPEAKLLNGGGRVVGKHYVGPTWEAKDGSTVVGAKLAGVVSDPTSIPWLLLAAASHTGNGRMSEVTFIQRLDTVGGLAPTTGCDATSAGSETKIDYAATYFFYEAGEEHSKHE